MAPIKLEDNMKERLEERTIEPTMAAWDRISSKLDAEQGAKKNKRIWWVSIAASFVAGTLVALFVFQNAGTTNTSPEFVETSPVLVDPVNEKNDKLNTVESNKVLEEAVVVEEPVKKEDTSEKTTIKETQKTISKNEQFVAQIDKKEKKDKTIIESNKEEGTQEGIAVTEKKSFKDPFDIKENKALNDAIAEKVNEVVAEVESRTSVTDEEIEALLKKAQREVVSQQIFNQKTNAVDANALLLDVEAEVAPASFRNKIFEVISEGYEKARDAVANRNN